MIASSFHGIIEEIPGICADNFERPKDVLARAYFLSHCHSDHTKGLNTTALLEALEQTGAKIYMSELTAAVIADEKTDERIIKHVVPLKMGTTLVTLPSVPDRNFEEEFINVTLIPAGHCLGSVMYLFRTKAKTILFTGDFRVNSSDLQNYMAFHKDNDVISIDAMYLDTTFINTCYNEFPKRSSSMEYALNEMKRCLDKGIGLALHTSAKYGYEFVFNEIYDKLNLKVYVNEDRWSFYRSYTHLIPGVTNDAESTRIHICRNRSDKQNHHKCLPKSSKDQKYLFVHFSAMKWSNLTAEDNVICKHSETRLDICFPTHSSRNEILYFVKYLSPKKVEGFPNEYKEDVNSSKGCAEVIVPKKRKIINTTSVGVKVDRKLDNALLRKMLS